MTTPWSKDLLSRFSGKTILVTGSSGYIGCKLVDVLSHVDCQLVLLDRTEVPEWWSGKKCKVRRVIGDVSKRETWDDILRNVDFVFHLAACEVFGDAYQVLPDFQVNTLSVIHFLESCSHRGSYPRMVNASSSNLFGLTDQLPLDEEIRDNPPVLWSLHKLSSEHYIRLYSQKFHFHAGSLRFANIYGPIPRKEIMTRVVLNKMMASALAKNQISLFKNKDCIRDYLYIDDAIHAFLLAMTTDRIFEDHRFFVVGSGEGKKIVEVAELMASEARQKSGRSVSLVEDLNKAMGPLEMRNFVARSALFEKTTDWKAKTSLAEGIHYTIQTLS